MFISVIILTVLTFSHLFAYLLPMKCDVRFVTWGLHVILCNPECSTKPGTKQTFHTLLTGSADTEGKHRELVQ